MRAGVHAAAAGAVVAANVLDKVSAEDNGVLVFLSRLMYIGI